MNTTEHYIFPFELVPQGARIVIYGAAEKGLTYLRQVLMTQYCSVICLADRNAVMYAKFPIPVILPEHIYEETFDFVVLAARTAKTCHAFQDVLVAQGVPAEKIIWRQKDDRLLLAERFLENAPHAENSWTKKKGILIQAAGGIGDDIVNKKFVEAMLTLDPDLHIDICCGTGGREAFLRFLFQDTSQVEDIRNCPMNVYEMRKMQYQAAVFFHGAVWARVDWLRRDSDLSKELFSALTRLEQKGREEPFSHDIPSHVFITRSIYRGEDCYRHLGAGILPIYDNHVAIPSEAAGKEAFVRMQLGRYVTVNCENGETNDFRRVAKSWPVDRFETLIALMHKFDPTLEVVQIGAKGTHPLAGVCHHVFGESFGLVREILAHSLLHIDIEGGLVHLATQLDTKCIVLFGPTQVEFYGYPQNINLQAGSCHGCCHLYPKDFNRCAQGMEEPECMYSITPEMVMEAVRTYFDECGIVEDESIERSK